jgi:hypothetical protein
MRIFGAGRVPRIGRRFDSENQTRPRGQPDSLQPLGRAHANRVGLPVMTRLHQCAVRRLWRLCMVIWALNTVPAPAGHCCPALLPTCEIAGKCIRASAPAERAPWIRICRLGVAKLRLAEQASGYDKKRDGQRAHHISLPVVVFACLSYYQFCRADGMSTPAWTSEPLLAAAASAACPSVISGWPIAGSAATP